MFRVGGGCLLRICGLRVLPARGWVLLGQRMRGPQDQLTAVTSPHGHPTEGPQLERRHPKA